MSYAGPSLIGFGPYSSGYFTNLITNGYVYVYGSNSTTKVLIVNNVNNTIFNIDTLDNIITTGASFIPIASNTYNLGSTTSYFNNLYVANISVKATDTDVFDVQNATGTSYMSVNTSTGVINFAGIINQTGANSFSTGTGNVQLNGPINSNINQIGANTFSTGSGNISLNGSIISNISQSGATTLSTGSGNISLNGNIVTNITQTGSTTLSTGSGNISLNGNIVTNISQTGSTSFSTGTGPVALNGATTFEGSLTQYGLGNISFNGSLFSYGTITLSTALSSSPNLFVLQNTQTGTGGVGLEWTWYNSTTAASATLVGNGTTMTLTPSGACTTLVIAGNITQSGTGSFTINGTMSFPNLTASSLLALNSSNQVVTTSETSLTLSTLLIKSTGTDVFDVQNASGTSYLNVNTSTGTITCGGSFTQSGSNTFSTGTGAVSINGSTTFAAGTITTHTTTSSSYYPAILILQNTTTTAGANANGVSLQFSWYNASTAATAEFTGGGTTLNLQATGACVAFISTAALSLGSSSFYWGAAYLGAITTNGNFSQTGSSTFTTGTGNVTINGNTGIAANLAITGSFTQAGSGTFSSGSGTVSLNGPTTITNGSSEFLVSSNNSNMSTFSTTQSGSAPNGIILLNNDTGGSSGIAMRFAYNGGSKFGAFIAGATSGVDYFYYYNPSGAAFAPDGNNSYSLGNSSNAWANLYSYNIYFGGQTSLATNIIMRAPNLVTAQAQCPAWNTYSSRALKENVADLTTALSTLVKVQGVTFTWVAGQFDSGSQIHQGFIAEDLAQVLPHMCNVIPDGSVEGVDYAKITPLLVEAVKELLARVKILEGLSNITNTP